jgi:hypothetical protein
VNRPLIAAGLVIGVIAALAFVWQWLFAVTPG